MHKHAKDNDHNPKPVWPFSRDVALNPNAQQGQNYSGKIPALPTGTQPITLSLDFQGSSPLGQKASDRAGKDVYPRELKLDNDGNFSGVIDVMAEVGIYQFKIRATNSAGHTVSPYYFKLYVMPITVIPTNK